MGRYRGLLAACLGTAIVLAPSVSSAAVQEVSPHRVSVAATDWLGEVNLYRTAAGLAPVTDNPSWDLGLQHHLTYLAKTPASYETGQYASAHTENPASPYYTPDGAEEGGSSNIGGGSNPVDAIDGWLSVPFHAVGILRPDLTEVAFAMDSDGRAALDVINGITSYAAPTAPTLFPGPGMTTGLFHGGGEYPNPLESCHLPMNSAFGLPLVALLTNEPDPQLSASLSGPEGLESSQNGLLCIVDEHTYRTTDTVYGPTGLSILEGDQAVFLIPQYPLGNGTFTARISQPGQPDVTWSFTDAWPRAKMQLSSQIDPIGLVRVELAPGGPGSAITTGVPVHLLGPNGAVVASAVTSGSGLIGTATFRLPLSLVGHVRFTVTTDETPYFTAARETGVSGTLDKRGCRVALTPGKKRQLVSGSCRVVPGTAVLVLEQQRGKRWIIVARRDVAVGSNRPSTYFTRKLGTGTYRAALVTRGTPHLLAAGRSVKIR